MTKYIVEIISAHVEDGNQVIIYKTPKNKAIAKSAEMMAALYDDDSLIPNFVKKLNQIYNTTKYIYLDDFDYSDCSHNYMFEVNQKKYDQFKVFVEENDIELVVDDSEREVYTPYDPEILADMAEILGLPKEDFAWS